MKKIISNYNKRFLLIAIITVMLTGATIPLQSVYAQGGVFRVFFHICRDDFGNDAGATEAQIQSEFNQLQTDFAPGNICFINMGIDYISNSNVNYYEIYYQSYDSLTPYEVPGCINLFYHRSIINWAGDSVRDESYTGNSKFASVARDYIGVGQSTSFVVGKALGLYSTWDHSFAWENINGNNSAWAGDRVTDTPADPWAFYDVGNACFQTNICCYNGSCHDQLQQTNYSPPYTNLMAEWWRLGWAPLALTSGQFARINDSTISTGAIALEQSAANTTIPAGNYGGGYELRSAIDVLNTSGTVHMYGNYKTTNIGGTVLLEPGFRANPSAGGYAIFKGHTCGYIYPRTASETNAANSATNENGLRCYPNPFSGNLNFEFNLSQDNHASIKLYNMMGKEIKAISKSFYAMGKHEIAIDANDIAAGIYFVVLQSSDFKQEQKIVKVN